MRLSLFLRPLGGVALVAALLTATLSSFSIRNVAADPPMGPPPNNSGGGLMEGGGMEGGGMNQPPSITGLYIEQLTGKRFRVAGYVGDEDPGGCGVVFSGAAAGAALCDDEGYFDVILNIPTLGTLTITPGDGVQSGIASDEELTNGSPFVPNFTATKNMGQWTFSGAIMDEACTGLTVTFSGPEGVDGETCVVAANGVFTFTVTLPVNSSGFVTATVEDWYGATGSAMTYFSD